MINQQTDTSAVLKSTWVVIYATALIALAGLRLVFVAEIARGFEYYGLTNINTLITYYIIWNLLIVYIVSIILRQRNARIAVYIVTCLNFLFLILHLVLVIGQTLA